MSGLIGQKSFASLSSGLLARKGHARPAMRPQGFPPFGSVSEAIDDLGWNDMGQPVTPSPVVPVPADAPAAPVPDVIRQREALKDEFEAVPEPVAVVAPVPAEVALKRRSAAKAPVPAKIAASVAAAAGRKAAFTLRLDAPRHLRLRLASALANRSAQQIVTQALDAYLKTMPDVEEMAGQLADRGAGDRVKGD